MSDRIQHIRSAGFSDEEISNWAGSKRRSLSEAGFSGGDIDAWFGKPPFNPKPITTEFNANIKKVKEVESTKVTSFVDSLDAGFQISVSGLLAREKTPSKVLDLDAPMSSRVASGVATLMGDIPFMVGGAFLGLIGGAPTGPGAAATGLAGAFGLPLGLRKVLMDKYENGEVSSFSEFWERLSGAVIETSKGLITGAATGLAGVGAKALPFIKASHSAVKTAAALSAEIPTMVSVGSALEGRVPNSEE